MKNRIFSTDSAKAVKAQEFGVLNAIMYMAPHKSAGVGNLCPNADGCEFVCLGTESGQAAMRKEGEDNSTTLSRKAKARRFMEDRQAYLHDVAHSIGLEYKKALRLGMSSLVVRLNGSTDVNWEGIRVDVSPKLAKALSKAFGVTFTAGTYANMFALFPMLQFVDYTKNPNRFIRKLPSNYHLTFSRSATNERIALALLARGVNVAAVFGGLMPATWHGYTVINGDEHDLRHLDPRGARGFVIGLAPKGRKAKKDTSGFVIWNHVDAADVVSAAA